MFVAIVGDWSSLKFVAVRLKMNRRCDEMLGFVSGKEESEKVICGSVLC